ncbi:hypothetical protein LF1_37180 [Rubripirellula obstinata]|uniref:Uncharacterized protein n=1 Tax=Rubripirellula obstinata TaxID=406547 RepID=A0A5B1CP80_9BACT|nr:hypothetical protein [Rubripirellula obstinata]KAA1261173.1 hypothetical protein LF1_37180 [Rubripirellula obstinata]
MRQTTHQVIVLYFLMAAFAAVSLVGQEPAPQSSEKPDGKPGAISEWGLSGIVWSEANLVRKLAVETAQSDPSLTPKQVEELEKVASGAETLVESMERFGWRRLRRGLGPSGSSQTTDSSLDDDSLGETDLPDPQQVGRQLADSMGLETDPKEITNLNPARDPAIVSRYDTETPIGHDDPGIDDERTANRLRIDIDHYRVDDYIDETPQEARNLADAREDGVEGAIAAADPEGIAGPTAGYISRREVQTRSTTLPYSQDSIYDADDYDPDVDYDVEHPLTERKMNREASEMLDGDDDISVRNPAIAAEGEDELLAAMERGGTARPDWDPATTAIEGNPTDRDHDASMPRYNVTPDARPADADWVQLHLELNEARWFAARDQGLSYQAVRSAQSRLMTTVESVRRASDSRRLRNLLGMN